MSWHFFDRGLWAGSSWFSDAIRLGTQVFRIILWVLRFQFSGIRESSNILIWFAWLSGDIEGLVPDAIKSSRLAQCEVSTTHHDSQEFIGQTNFSVYAMMQLNELQNKCFSQTSPPPKSFVVQGFPELPKSPSFNSAGTILLWWASLPVKLSWPKSYPWGTCVAQCAGTLACHAVTPIRFSPKILWMSLSSGCCSKVILNSCIDLSPLQWHHQSAASFLGTVLDVSNSPSNCETFKSHHFSSRSQFPCGSLCCCLRMAPCMKNWLLQPKVKTKDLPIWVELPFQTCTKIIKNLIEPTNPNAMENWLHIYCAHFFSGHTCLTLFAGHSLLDTLARHSCWTLLLDTLAGHSCWTLFLDTLSWHSLLDTLSWHSC